jgi:hypothetical protein
MHFAEALLEPPRMHCAEAPSLARSADCIERTARRRALKYCGALTAWRQEPQPGASTANRMECTTQQRSLKRRGMHRAEAHTLIPRSAICIEAGASTLTAWRPEPQPGASTRSFNANRIEARPDLSAWRNRGAELQRTWNPLQSAVIHSISV